MNTNIPAFDYFYLANMKTIIIVISFLSMSNILIGQDTNGKNIQLPDTIYSVAEVMPKFKNGESELFKLISNGKLPLYAKQNRIYGDVEIEIAVDTNGNVIQTKVLKSLGYGCDEEGVKIINKTSGKWISGKKWGKKVAVKLSLIIQFKPQQDGLNEKAKSFYQQGLKIYNNKKYANALTFFKTAIELSPQYIDAHFYSGNCLFNLRRKPEACIAWGKSIDLGLVNSKKYQLQEYCEKDESLNNMLPKVIELTAVDSIIYNKTYHFKDGAYKTYDEFRFNSPSIKYRYRSEEKKDELNLHIEKDTNVVLYGIEANLVNKLRRKGVWGYSKDGEVYVLSYDEFGLKNEFMKLDKFGGMLLTSNDIKVYKGGVTPGAVIAVGTGGVSAGVGAAVHAGYTTRKIKLRIVDAETGEIGLYNLENFKKILKRDKMLYADFIKIKGEKKKRDMMFIYLKKYNEHHPFFIMSTTAK